jgi:hypothetical protein
MELSERALEDFIYEHPSVIDVERWIGRQMVTKYGIIDLVGVGSNDDLYVIELKAVPYHPKHVTQLNRYLSCLCGLAVDFGYRPVNSYKVLIVPYRDFTKKEEIEIIASDIWLYTYVYNHRSNVIDIFEPFDTPSTKGNELRVDRSCRSVQNYINFVATHQPKRRE